MDFDEFLDPFCHVVVKRLVKNTVTIHNYSHANKAYVVVVVVVY